MSTPYELSAEEEALYDLSDEELTAAFKEAKANQNTAPEEPTVDDENVDDEFEEGAEDEIEEPAEDDEDLEQPDEDSEDDEIDSDDEEDEEDSTDDEVEEEVDEDETDDPDEDLDEDESDKSEDEADETNKEPEVETFKYKANGQEFEFTDKEVKEQFGKVFAQSMNYTQKMQEIAPWRRTISALKDSGMSHDDVNLMIDVLKGDKEAIASIVQKAGIDTLDLEPAENALPYTPKEYGKSDAELAIDDVVDVISKDPEYSTTQHVVNTQWDSSSRSELIKDPSLIKDLHEDVRSGVFAKVSPMATKLKVLDGGSKSDIEYYVEAGKQYYAGMLAKQQAETDAQEAQRTAEAEKLQIEKEAVKATKERQVKQKTIKKAANKRKAAAPTKKAAGKKGIIDYLDDSDESFDDWYKKLQASV